MKPDGTPNLNAPEWLLYNILDMRFIQGRRVREIADRLAISESDLYRKQRVAVGQVAQVSGGDGTPGCAGSPQDGQRFARRGRRFCARGGSRGQRKFG